MEIFGGLLNVKYDKGDLGTVEQLKSSSSKNEKTLRMTAITNGYPQFPQEEVI